MLKLEDLHKYHLALLAFVSIGCKSFHELFLYYISQYFRYYDKNDSEERSFGKFLEYFKINYEGLFENLVIAKYPQFTSTIFTDDTKQSLKREVYLRTLDTIAISDILENTPFFPSSESKHRRNLNCKSGKHVVRCCSSCNGKHLCPICKKSKCKVNCISSGSDHLCSNASCLAKSSDCYEKSTVCCKKCALCFYCMGRTPKNCDDRAIREVIKVIICLRNLVAHSNDGTWEDLKNGTFCSPDFPNCKSWDDLSNNIHAKHLKLLSFLEHNKVISLQKYNIKKYELNIIVEAGSTKSKILEQFSGELMLEYMRTMIEELKKKSLCLTFEVGLLNKKIDRNLLQLNGEVMNSICKEIEKVISNETRSGSNSIPEVIREKCKLVHRDDPQALRVKFKIEPRDATAGENLCKFKDPASSVSKQLWETISKWIKDGIHQQFDVKVDLMLEEWKLGSVIIQVVIFKTDKTLWTLETLKFVQSRIKRFSEGFDENVEITILPRKETVQEQKIKFIFRIVGVQDLIHNEFKLISKATNIVNFYIKDVEEGKKEIPSVLEKKNLTTDQKEPLIKFRQYIIEDSEMKKLGNQGSAAASGGSEKKIFHEINWPLLRSDSSDIETCLRKEEKAYTRGESSVSTVAEREMQMAITSISNQEIKTDKEMIEGEKKMEASKREEYSVIHEATYGGRNWSFNDVYNLLINKDYTTFRKLFNCNRIILNKFRNDRTYTFLIYASHLNHPHIVQHLTEEFKDDIDVWAVDGVGWNAYHCAAMNDNVDVMKHLLSFDRSRLDVGNNRGWTPLHLAARRDSKRTVELLLDGGASVDVLDNKGRKPDRRTRDVEIIKMLRDHRTKSSS